MTSAKIDSPDQMTSDEFVWHCETLRKIERFVANLDILDTGTFEDQVGIEILNLIEKEIISLCRRIGEEGFREP